MAAGAIVALLPAVGSAEYPSSPAGIVPEVDGDTVRLDVIRDVSVMDTTTLFDKFKKSKFVRDFPTIYADTMVYENGTFVFRALVMKKFWRRLKWLTSRERPVKALPDSLAHKGDSILPGAESDTVPERSMVRFISRD